MESDSSRPAWRWPAVIAAALALLVGVAAPAWGLFGSSRSVGANVVSTSVLAPPTGLAATTSCPGTSSIEFRGVGSGIATPGSFMAIGKPPATVAGDVLVAVVNWDESASISAPADWTHIRTDVETTDNWRQSMFWKVAGPSEPINYSFTSTGASPEESVGVVGAYSGVNTTNPIDVHGGRVKTGTFTTPIVAPSVTTTVAGARLLGFFGSTAVGDITPPPGMTERRDVQYPSGDGAAIELADEVFASPGATGTRTAQQTVSNLGIGQLVALRPASVGSDAQATLTWTPTTSGFATGYTLRRRVGATVQSTQNLTPRTVATYIDGPLVSGTTYVYELESVYASWTSTTASVAVTRSCP